MKYFLTKTIEQFEQFEQFEQYLNLTILDFL